MKALINCLIGAALCGVLGCNKTGAVKEAPGTLKSYTIAVIPKGTTHEFWKSINAGAFKARDELAGKGLNVEVIWKGPLKEDDRDQQIQI